MQKLESRGDLHQILADEDIEKEEERPIACRNHIYANTSWVTPPSERNYDDDEDDNQIKSIKDYYKDDSWKDEL